MIKILHRKANKKLDRKVFIPKIMFSLLFACALIILSKTKLTPIFGTDSKLSAAAIFGPVISSVIGVVPGSATIIFAQLVGYLIGFYSIKSVVSLLTFAPILFGGIYFARHLKGGVRLMVLPAACIVAFLLHPIGRSVWFYSLFWTIPILVTYFKPSIDHKLRKVTKHYEIISVLLAGLAATFIDHSVGSIIYLYFYNIEAKFWIMAIPFTVVERLFLGFGIGATYLGIRAALKVMRKSSIAILIPVEQKVEVGIKNK